MGGSKALNHSPASAPMFGNLAGNLIFVAGCPSGGTSCVAGVLHHLGVDMGRFIDRPGIRGYTTYEDTTANQFKDASGRLKVAAYVNHRLNSPGGSLRGFKHTPLWLDCAADLPLQIIHVRRPLEDSIVSDWAKVQTVAGANQRERAGTVARAWMAARQVAARYPLIATVDFYTLLAERVLCVTSLAQALGLPTEGPKWRAAVGSVRTRPRGGT